MIRIQMTETAKRIVRQVLASQPGKKVCILVDTEQSHAILETLAMAVRNAGAIPVTVIMLPTGMGGVEPPKVAAAALAAANAIILLVSYALTHNRAIRDSLKMGTRIVNPYLMEKIGVVRQPLLIHRLTMKQRNLRRIQLSSSLRIVSVSISLKYPIRPRRNIHSSSMTWASDMPRDRLVIPLIRSLGSQTSPGKNSSLPATSAALGDAYSFYHITLLPVLMS